MLKEAFRDLEEKPPDGRMRRIREFDAARSDLGKTDSFGFEIILVP